MDPTWIQKPCFLLVWYANQVFLWLIYCEIKESFLIECDLKILSPIIFGLIFKLVEGTKDRKGYFSMSDISKRKKVQEVFSIDHYCMP